LLEEEFVEDVVQVGGIGGGGGYAVGSNELEDGPGGAEARGVVAEVGELVADGVDGAGGSEVEVAGDIVPEFLATAMKFGHEVGVVVLPAVKGGAIDADARADLVFIVVAEEAVEGVFLFFGAGAVGDGCGGVRNGVWGGKMGKRIFAFCWNDAS